MPDAYRRLYEDLRWAGLQWDEGETHAASEVAITDTVIGPETGGSYGPYIQVLPCRLKIVNALTEIEKVQTYSDLQRAR